MFETIKQRFRDMSTIKTLCLAAEQHANADGKKAPGAEHFVLAALESPDGTARKAFEHIGADPNGLREAIAQQYADALKAVGIDTAPGAAGTGEAAVVVPPGTGAYQTQASAQSMVQLLASQQKANAGAPLLSAHVLVAVAAAQHGVAIRALKAMGVDPKALAEAAAVEISAATVYEI
ncbi:MAG: Clp protease N-terminal domain-containing protein [Pseudomonadota bacterium]